MSDKINNDIDDDNELNKQIKSVIQEINTTKKNESICEKGSKCPIYHTMIWHIKTNKCRFGTKCKNLITENVMDNDHLTLIHNTKSLKKEKHKYIKNFDKPISAGQICQYVCEFPEMGIPLTYRCQEPAHDYCAVHKKILKISLDKEN